MRAPPRRPWSLGPRATLDGGSLVPYVRLMLVQYPEELPLREARKIYFAANQFGDDGGYGNKWVDFKLGKIPFPVPNSPARVRAVRYHDLHHVLTGYDTTTVGEFEISAWEIAAGCRGFAAAWALNLSAMLAGVLVAPRRTFRAFVRGRRSRTVYGEPFDPLLDVTVRDARDRYLAQEVEPSPSLTDAIAFGLALAASLVVGLAMMAIVVPLVPVGLISLSLLRRRRERERAAE
jgi:hypothetical protein